MESGNQFLFEVKEMRKAQKEYFNNGKTPQQLKRAKQAEQRVDDYLKAYEKMISLSARRHISGDFKPPREANGCPGLTFSSAKSFMPVITGRQSQLKSLLKQQVLVKMLAQTHKWTFKPSPHEITNQNRAH